MTEVERLRARVVALLEDSGHKAQRIEQLNRELAHVRDRLRRVEQEAIELSERLLSRGPDE